MPSGQERQSPRSIPWSIWTGSGRPGDFGQSLSSHFGLVVRGGFPGRPRLGSSLRCVGRCGRVRPVRRRRCGGGSRASRGRRPIAWRWSSSGRSSSTACSQRAILASALSDVVGEAVDLVEGGGLLLAAVAAELGEGPDLAEALLGDFEAVVGPVRAPSWPRRGRSSAWRKAGSPVGWPVLEERSQFGLLGEEPLDAGWGRRGWRSRCRVGGGGRRGLAVRGCAGRRGRRRGRSRGGG